jgi:hypothetical protein
MSDEPKSPYEDIIHLPHHVSSVHKPMSRQARAAQFASFAALTGYEEEVKEAGRLTQRRRELAEGEQEELNRQLNRLRDALPNRPLVTLTYFVPDHRKAGGAYRALSGRVVKLTSLPWTLVLESGEQVRVDTLLRLELEE